MPKLRVHELAKEYKLDTKGIIKLLNKLNIDVKSHASALSEDEVKKFKEYIGTLSNKQASDQSITQFEEVKVVSEILEVVSVTTETITSSIQEKPINDEFKIVILDSSSIIVKDLATKLGVSISEIMKVVLTKGMTLNLNQSINIDVAKAISSAFSIILEIKEERNQRELREEKMLLDEIEEDESSLKTRPPVITIMGHVDHGKTKLLDAIRNTNVVATEAGGITQHIGAYQVTINNRVLTFIDTPGHEAFTEIRARGTQVTDIVILLIAADDGVMPQTLEAIDHAKAAKVPIIVAINKMDKPDANPEKVKQQLADRDLVSEDWGGKTIMVPVSAKTGTGIKELLEMLILMADMEDLKANPDKLAIGTVIESRLSRKKGPVATVLIRSGTLHVGDNFVVGPYYGKVKALLDENGQRRQEAGPSTPAEILGISDVPLNGDIFQAVATEKEAKRIAQEREEELRKNKLEKKHAATMELVSQRIKSGDMQTINLIIKADVQGSMEAVVTSLKKIKVATVSLNILHSGTGAISESDIMLAKTASAIVVGFGVAINTDIKKKADDEEVVVKIYPIIYQIIEEIEKVMAGLLAPKFEAVLCGAAEVREVYKSSKVGQIAGCYVTEGKIVRNASIEILRGKNIIYQGTLDSLKRFKDDAKEVKTGFECGIAVKDFNDYQEKDVIKVFELIEIKT